MGRYLGPKCRQCRREGVKLFLKGDKCLGEKCPFNKRSYAPGMYYDRAPRLSDYGRHLREKQKVKRMYGMSEKQFRRFFEMVRNQNNKGSLLLQLLERRLDNVVTKIGWAVSPFSARQVVRHGHIKVNGKKVDIPSYLVEKGDVITIDKKVWNNKPAKVAWLEIGENSCSVLSYPTRDMIDPGIKEYLIVEFYSR